MSLKQQNKILNMDQILLKEENLQSFLGSDIDSLHIQSFINEIEVRPAILKLDNRFIYSFYSFGFDSIVSLSGIITHIYLLPNGSENHQPFLGYIPYDIKGNDTIDSIKNKLGKPNVQDYRDGRRGDNWYYWKNKGLSIKFRKKIISIQYV